MKTKLIWALLLFCGVFLSCNQKQNNLAFDKILSKSQYTVLMFFAPDCPLCITFSKQFNELSDKYEDIQFLAVQSGNNYSAMELKMYKDNTDLKPHIFLDRDYSVAHKFNASITPEFFVVDQTGLVLYQGLLDNRMKELGVYKQHWDQFYLEEALKEISNNSEVSLKKTEAIGCVLEY
ncbi:MAG: redoxin domain-containing protein [Bacteroidia bacterium]